MASEEPTASTSIPPHLTEGEDVARTDSPVGTALQQRKVERQHQQNLQRASAINTAGPLPSPALRRSPS